MLGFQSSLSLGLLAGACLLAMPAAQAGSSGTITVQGDVPENCEIRSIPSTVDLGELSQSSSEAIAFDFSCNAPFAYSLTSQNGALEHTTRSGVIGFATSLGYGLDISLPTDGVGISDSCTSAEIELGSVTCSFSDSGTDIALNKTGGLTLNWSVPAPGAGTPLLAGNYADSLTLTISTLP